MWVTEDGNIAANYYQTIHMKSLETIKGCLSIWFLEMGNQIDYKEDTGFTADEEFIDDKLYHVRMVLCKEVKE